MDPKHLAALVLLDISVVISAARLAGALCRKIGQPEVLGEIAAGIALGPTLLGLLPGHLDAVLFPDAVRSILGGIAQLGLVLFMFIVGLEVDVSMLRGRGRAAGAIAAGAMLLPLGLGAGMAAVLYPSHRAVAGHPVPEFAFVLFFAVAMAITALPVLARILAERRMQRLPVGVLALAGAVIIDVLGWSLLAIAVAGASGGNLTGAARIVALTAGFALVAALVGRPLLGRLIRWHARCDRLRPDMLAVVLVGVLTSGFITELIGVHAIFGAFTVGVIMPRRDANQLIRQLLQRLEQVCTLLLLPVFFVVAGLGVNVAAVGPSGWQQLSLIMLAAVVGKIGGGMLAARGMRLPRRTSTAIGVLMNTRGLTEIVILQIGVQLGILDSELFTIMVLMALLTTLMTGPLLRWVYPDRVVTRELAVVDRVAGGTPADYTVVVALPKENAAPVAQLGRRLVGVQEPARIVLCRFLPAPAPLELASGIAGELGLIADVGAEVRRIAAALTSAGSPPCSVVVRFAADPAGEVVSLATAVRADVLVTTIDLAPPTPVAPGTTGVVVKSAHGTDPAGSVVAVVDGGPGGRAAVRLGAQLALAGHTELGLCPDVGRRAAKQCSVALDSLGRCGIAARVVGQRAAGDAAVVVAASSAALAADLGRHGTLCLVRPDQADRDDELTQTIDRISAPPVTGLVHRQR
jgi:Kef-type K+ transport system membrane component KefB